MESYEKDRKYFSHLLKKHNLYNIGILIGVKKGEFAKMLLSNWTPKHLYLIDPWDDISIYDNNLHKTIKFHNEDFFDCCENLKEYQNVSYIKEFSHYAFSKFEDNSIDFIYIDGNHNYNSVKRDLEIWYPKLKRNGIIAGDDYTINDIEIVFGYEFGVKKAVDEFCIKHHKNLSIDIYGSWFYDKENNVRCRNWYFIK